MERKDPREPRHSGVPRDSRDARVPGVFVARKVSGESDRVAEVRPRAAQGAASGLSAARKIPFFRNLCESDLSAISRRFTERRFKAGDYVFREGEPSSCLYAIKKGHIKVFRESPEGHRRVLEILSAGDVCGTSGLLAGTQIASAQAVEDTEVHAMSREDFLYLLDTNKTLAREVIAFLARQLVRLHEMVINFASGRVEQRIAALLLGLSQRHGSPVRGGVKIGIRLTRQDIADIVGTTVETSIRVMSKFRKRGLVGSNSRELVITDMEGLRRVLKGPGAQA
ncbi:MAG: Crp/Fnr family transcriptional regulator [Candidatus Eisenbacteria bacterium]|nr:Crp/Fnr family transcriptional regulator [Candidatus Eisenbacteria bacterium]